MIKLLNYRGNQAESTCNGMVYGFHWLPTRLAIGGYRFGSNVDREMMTFSQRRKKTSSFFFLQAFR